jgi:methylglyoxal synthase
MPEHALAPAGRRIALIAHDNKKRDMLEWAEYNLDLLAGHELFATATTGHLLQQLGLPVTCFRSGPYGGDQQIGARIAEGEIDLLVFLWDPLEPHPHDPDVKVLLRVAVVCNIPVACNRATADFMISSPLMSRSHQQWDPAPGQAALTVARASLGGRSGCARGFRGSGRPAQRLLQLGSPALVRPVRAVPRAGGGGQ